MYTSTLAERLERHIVTPMTDDDCWLTDLPTKNGGYPVLTNGSILDGTKRVLQCNRVMWEAHNAEPIPDGLIVLHSCDNAGCVNPAHLSVGTYSDNNRQSAERSGRIAHRDSSGRFCKHPG